MNSQWWIIFRKLVTVTAVYCWSPEISIEGVCNGVDMKLPALPKSQHYPVFRSSQALAKEKIIRLIDGSVLSRDILWQYMIKISLTV